MRSFGKAHFCQWLHGRLHNATVPDSYLISRAEWSVDQRNITNSLFEHRQVPLIVRSSAPTEDRPSSSQAGHFLTVSSVMNERQLTAAVEAVFGSYGRQSPKDILFVQEMVRDVQCVGVAFTVDPDTGSPYLIVNYAETDQTDAITSGRGSYATWVALDAGHSSPPLAALQGVPAAITEIKQLCEIDNLDIEFAVSSSCLYILQVRELATRPDATPCLASLSKATGNAVEKLRSMQARAPGVLGQSTTFGVMPDWNPAEIIGINPRPLATSIYRCLITDRHWSRRRADYGYRRVINVPLMHEVLGVPFIDVRASFNSLVPAALSDEVAANFIDAAVARLSQRRELHDKIEFAVLPTCYIADLENTLEARFAGSLSIADRANIAEAVKLLTCSIVDQSEALDRWERSQVAELTKRREQSQLLPPMERLAALLSDAAEFGTTPFVGQARRAFIAIDILRSLVRDGTLSEKRFAVLLASVDTVAGRFQRDRSRLTSDDLLGTYGHLRPGTYDITAPRYDQFPTNYLASSDAPGAEGLAPFVLSRDETIGLGTYLARLACSLSPEEFIALTVKAIAAREQTKFEFTKNVSEALELMAELCRDLGLTRDDASYLRIADFFSADFGLGARERSEARRADYVQSCSAKLPLLIVSPEELWSFNFGEGQPNFIGASTVTARPLNWPTSGILEGAILLIENADPGFDWIFGTKISGFVTMFGGPNSHMAIRAHELGVTAVVGAGPTLFKRWQNAGLLRIDPIVKKTEVMP